MKLFVTGLLVFVVVVCLVFGIGYVNVYNQEVHLRNKAAEKFKVCEGFYDRMWKVINQKAQVSAKYSDDFAKIYPQLIKGRYEQNSKLLAQFITEANPNFDTSLFKDLMGSIEAERAGFFNEQKELRNMQSEYNTLLESFFASYVVGHKPKMDYPIITSDTSKDTFTSGKDNNTGVFK